MRSAPFSFWVFFGATTVLSCLCARHLGPGVADEIRPGVYSFHDKFLGSYGPVNLDEYILWHDILGTTRQIQTKDILLLGSSKMMFGVDAAQLEDRLKVGVYNLSLGHGEGLVFPTLLIKRFGIRNKLLIIDATDNTSQYHMEAVSQTAIKSSVLDAWKVIVEANLQYRFDWLLQGLVPRGKIDSSGFTLDARYLRPNHWREWSTGDLLSWSGPNTNLATPGTYQFVFDSDWGLEETVFPVFRDFNLDYGFISIPYIGYDPKWARQAAKYVGCWYLPVESHDLYTLDGTHLTLQSRELFTRRLADALVPESFGLSTRFLNIRTGQIVRPAPVPRDSFPPPVLKQVVLNFNIVLFKGRYYCLPHGLAVDWTKDVASLPGVSVQASLDEAVAWVNARHASP